MIGTTRRTFGAMLAAGLLARPASGQRTDAQLITRAIPSSGERLPAAGLGTAYVFDSDNEQTQRAAAGVLATLVETGGRLVDTGSTYGSAEIVLGNAIASAGLRDKIFITTKLEAPGAAELKRSLTRLKMTKLDLLQFHNVSNPRQSLAQFKDWKTQGICRYIGITSTFHRDFAAIEAVLRRENPDFVQIDYSVDNREVEKRILPLAADCQGRGIDCPTLRQRPTIPYRAWPIPSRLGEGFCGQLGPVLSQIPSRRSACDGGYSWHLQPGAHGG